MRASTCTSDCTLPLALPVLATLKSPASTPLTASSKVRVKLRVCSAVGEGPSRVIVLGRGARASISTAPVLPMLLSSALRSLPSASRRLPPLSSMSEPTLMPLLPCWPLLTVMRNTNAVLPEPER
ncbi:hypothetical protein D3C76_1279600 [compost metagenome]